MRRTAVTAIAVCLLLAGSMFAQNKQLAATPPMGWNSWDSYGIAVDEAAFKANAEWMAKNLKSFGWQYVVVDMEWYVTNPELGGNSKQFQYVMDEHGRYMPDPKRFPSAANGAGFKPLADYIHGLGLKFGIHILRGVPKQAVEKNLTIAGSSHTAADAANSSETCPWNFDNYGTGKNEAAAQAYYDSIAQLYAGWGLDMIKVDCIAANPYKGDEIRMFSTALRKTGRPIVLSLSPGDAPIEKLQEMRQYANMWRISNDIWDLWHSRAAYPQGLGDQFPRAAKWAGLWQPGAWPDADMLPFGYLGPAPGHGKPRYTEFSHDEQRTLMTLWCMFRSPLMMGGDLPRSDEWTRSLLTNPEVLAVDQRSTENRAVISNDKTAVWTARADSGDHYVAVFNLTNAAADLQFTWNELGLSAKSYKLRDLWERKDIGSADAVKVTLPSHGSVLYRVKANAAK